MEFLLETSLSPLAEFSKLRKKFFQTQAVEKFLNTVELDARGKERLYNWLRFKAVEVVEGIVYEEMEGLQEDFMMKMQDVTPEYLLHFSLDDYTNILKNKSSVLRCILQKASQTN
ncbi:hypothetical protein GYMLUDRAFT_170029 [Collybiopsis luxurians FD-317 M1]|uniref:Uncharacterized protein n=1 Tax=Collybiopsis luxurians FD-317 M1 TaxID=944289 RepID=A0A0D0CKT9_9AGAR|nr:hypothetical protein GYMLUDRAFT_170029 [Collybiopsis luxurians FD-317 M1]